MVGHHGGVPIIDMAKLSEGSQRGEIKKIGKACEDWGFFLASFGGKAEACSEGRRSSGLWQDICCACRTKLNWGDFLHLIMLPSEYRDLNVRPFQPTEFSEVMNAYNGEIKSLSRALMSLIPETLRLKPDFLGKKFVKSYLRIGMNYRKPDRFELSPHADITGQKLLLQDDKVLGLNICKDDQWIAVQPIPYYLVLNVGTLIQVTQKQLPDQFFPSESNGVVGMENQKPPAVDDVPSKGVVSINMSEMDDPNYNGKQQPPAAPLNTKVEDDNLKQEISDSVAAYNKHTDCIYKLLTLGAMMYAPAVAAVFSGQHCNGLVLKYKLIILPAIVTGGVVFALLRIYWKQFHLLKRVRLLIQNRNSPDHCPREGIELRNISRSYTSGMSVDIAEIVDDLDIWWPAERAAVVAILVAFLICLWLY